MRMQLISLLAPAMAQPTVSPIGSFNVSSSFGITYAQALTCPSKTETCAWSVQPPSARTGYEKQNLTLDSYLPEDAKQDSKRPAIICIHGGGYTGGDSKHENCNVMGPLFASGGFSAFSINYRLANAQGNVPGNWSTNCGNPIRTESECADPSMKGDLLWMPQYAYPAIRDAKAAVRWVRANAERYNVDPDFITVYGGSAGGTTVTALALLLEADYKTEITLEEDPTLSTTNLEQSSSVATVIDHWGSDWMARQLWLRGSGPNRYSKANPPIAIFHGTNDITVPFHTETSRIMAGPACGDLMSTPTGEEDHITFAFVVQQQKLKLEQKHELESRREEGKERQQQQQQQIPSSPALVDLYVAGQADTKGTNYTCFRIPSLVRTKTGLVAFAEGRRGAGGCSDQGDVRIVSRTSDDAGATWGPITPVLSETGHTIGNPSPVTDLTTGTLWLLYARDDNEVFVTSSGDGGKSWGKSSNVTAALKPIDDSTSWVATGPPGGVQLASGRLVTAAYYNHDDKDKSTRAYAVFSDDHGKTWQHGEDVGINLTPGQSVWGGGESQVVPFGGANGLAMLIRARTTVSQAVSQAPQAPQAHTHPKSRSSSTGSALSNNPKLRDVAHNHALAFSTDGGNTWTNSSRMSGIKTVYCEGSIAAADNGDLLISSPSSGNGVRINVTVWAAKKATPTEFEYLLTLYSGSSAYSSMLSLQNGGEYINLFERENSKYISMAKFKYP